MTKQNVSNSNDVFGLQRENTTMTSELLVKNNPLYCFSGIGMTQIAGLDTIVLGAV